MRILHISPYFFPAELLGGTARIVLNLVKNQEKNGHKVSIYTTDVSTSQGHLERGQDNDLLRSNINVFYFKNLSMKLALHYNFYFPLGFFKYLSSTVSGFDIIHLHEIYTLMHLWTAVRAYKSGIPFVLSPQGTATIVSQAKRVFRKKIFNIIFGSIIYEKCSNFIASSKNEVESLQVLGISSKKITYIPNGIELSEFKNMPDRMLLRKEYSIPENVKILLYMGRIHPKKGINLVVNSLPTILEKFNNVLFLVAGPVSDKNYLQLLKSQISKQNIENNIKFIGPITGRKKLELFSAADVFILPSYQEGLPVSALEAGAAGLPLMVSKETGIESLENMRAGLYINHNPQHIAESLVKIFSRDKFRKYYGENSKKLIKSNYSSILQSERIEKLYEKLIEKKM